MFPKWATIVDNRVRERGLAHRARVLAEDARVAFPRFPSGCARAVFVHFPDPWWKKRHEKRLVITTDLLPQLCRVLVPGGALFIQTDVEGRAAEYAALIATESRLVPQHVGFEAENPYNARSPREHRAIADGTRRFARTIGTHVSLGSGLFRSAHTGRHDRSLRRLPAMQFR